jgi:hypothetical protein
MGFQSKKKANEYFREYNKRPEAKLKKAELQRAYQKTEEGRLRYNASKYRYRDKLKERVLLHYGDGKIECTRCGFDNIDALCLDHINDNGAEHRKELGIASRGGVGSYSTFAGLLKNKLPEGLQILCANCNMIKEMERKKENRNKNPFYEEKEVVPLCQK